jgi:phage/conjugal plasmid C-4 type zinc finger TraR family protein
MATGWSRDGAVQEQIDASLDEAIESARSKLPSGTSREHCEACGYAIPESRRAALPGVRRCLACQRTLDAAERGQVAYNRRGSKGSQLR